MGIALMRVKCNPCSTVHSRQNKNNEYSNNNKTHLLKTVKFYNERNFESFMQF